MATEYVLGFLFDVWAKEYIEYAEIGEVVLITKNRPAWQAGKMNGVGGHIEVGETPLEAVRREFLEEAGFDFENWEYKVRYVGADFVLHIFSGFNPGLIDVRTTTDEIVSIEEVKNLPINIIYNLNWIIPLLLDPHVNQVTVTHNNEFPND